MKVVLGQNGIDSGGLGVAREKNGQFTLERDLPRFAGTFGDIDCPTINRFAPPVFLAGLTAHSSFPQLGCRGEAR